MKQKKAQIAVLLTCFNRKEKTLRCIESLKCQEGMPKFDLYICDDASTDGTKEAVLENMPNAIIIHGTGNLFWSRGMYVAMSAAVKKKYEYYLMINDDVEFFSEMWQNIFEPFREGKVGVAVVGYTRSRINNRMSYGGRKMIKTRTNYVIGPFVELQTDGYAQCDVANWNCFLIDKIVIKEIGLIDPSYEHGLGDFDYCLRMRKLNKEILVAKCIVGYCENNSKKKTYLDSNIPRLKRIKLMLKPNGFPVKSWFHFVNKHYGIHKYRSAISPYIRGIIAITLGKDIE